MSYYIRKISRATRVFYAYFCKCLANNFALNYFTGKQSYEMEMGEICPKLSHTLLLIKQKLISTPPLT